MLTTVYLDALFLLNGVMDYCLLIATGKLTDAVIQKWRVLIAAVCGGLYGITAVLYREIWVAAFVIQLVASVLMVMIAFGVQAFFRVWASYLGANFALGGCVFAVSLFTGEAFFAVSLPTLIASGLLCYAMLSIVMRRVARLRPKLCEVLVEYCGRECRLNAFMDTGMHVKDPVSNASVILVESAAVKNLFPERAFQALCRAEPECFLKSRFRLIPYHTVGSEQKLLTAFRPDRVLVNGRIIPRALVALSPTSIADHGEFEALIGEETLR